MSVHLQLNELVYGMQEKQTLEKEANAPPPPPPCETAFFSCRSPHDGFL